MSSADASSHPYTLARAKYGKIPFMKRIYAKQDELHSSCNPDCIDVDDFALMVSAGVNYIEDQKDLLDEAMESGQLLKDELLAKNNHIKSLETSQAIDREAYQRLANENELLRAEAAGEKRLKKILEDGFQKLAAIKNKLEAENKRLTMLLEEAERNCFSDSD
jgi:hypothetical protein